MNYEEKYKQALEWAKSIYPSTLGVDREDLEHFFPELKESEDEKIRKGLIALLYFALEDGSAVAPGHNVTKEEAIAWLEKLKVFAEHGDGLYYFGNNGFTYVGNPTCDNVSWPFDYENATIIQKDFAPKKGGEQ